VFRVSVGLLLALFVVVPLFLIFEDSIWSLIGYSNSKIAKRNAISPTNVNSSGTVEGGKININSSIERIDAERRDLGDKIRTVTEQQLNEQWNAPIIFYGKVVDEAGLGVSDAEVELVWNTVSGTSFRKLRTSPDGTFEIEGINGYLLGVVEIKKEGYYTSKEDEKVFYYGKLEDNHHPDRGVPSLFHLHKIHGAERLILVKRNLKVQRDGAPLTIDLTSGALVREGSETLTVQCWTNDKDVSPLGHFDWRCRISINGGGLLLSTNEFDFTAPETGYTNVVRFEMLREKPEGWFNRVHANLFFKTAKTNYGRLDFTMIASGDHYCMIDSFLNPAGSSNVEFNGTNAVRMRAE
jgi:hypothetical protein